MATETMESDKGLGLSIVFGVLALAGAGVALVGHDSSVGAYGFGAAIVFGIFLVAAIHLYE